MVAYLRALLFAAIALLTTLIIAATSTASVPSRIERRPGYFLFRVARS
jgi:hypothetical protein